MHGTDDPLVPYGGGPLAGIAAAGGRVLSVDATARLWATARPLRRDSADDAGGPAAARRRHLLDRLSRARDARRALDRRRRRPHLARRAAVPAGARHRPDQPRDRRDRGDLGLLHARRRRGHLSHSTSGDSRREGRNPPVDDRTARRFEHAEVGGPLDPAPRDRVADVGAPRPRRGGRGRRPARPAARCGGVVRPDRHGGRHRPQRRHGRVRRPGERSARRLDVGVRRHDVVAPVRRRGRHAVRPGRPPIARHGPGRWTRGRRVRVRRSHRQLRRSRRERPR